jgi:hypothetical protein
LRDWGTGNAQHREGYGKRGYEYVGNQAKSAGGPLPSGCVRPTRKGCRIS